MGINTAPALEGWGGGGQVGQKQTGQDRGGGEEGGRNVKDHWTCLDILYGWPLWDLIPALLSFLLICDVRDTFGKLALFRKNSLFLT